MKTFKMHTWSVGILLQFLLRYTGTFLETFKISLSLQNVLNCYYYRDHILPIVLKIYDTIDKI